jgi:PTH1 family peptidyl-tRNA hydrolase
LENDLLVICDDLSLPLGKLRIRTKGSAGGQKGLADILRELGSQAIPRLRIGIDACPDKWDAADYVLGRFRESERPAIEVAIQQACQAVEAWCLHGIDYCMNQFNRQE